MVIDWGLVLLLALGVILGGIAFSPTFRRKFFAGLRRFISGIGGQQTRTPTTQEPEDRTKVRRIRTIHMVTCPVCKGKKRIPKKLPAIADQSLAPLIPCPTCGGTGEVEEGTVD